MKTTLFLMMTFLLTYAHAGPSTYRGHCLDALADMEFGEKRDAKFELQANVESAGKFIWSGNTIRKINSGFFGAKTRDVWSAEEFKRDDDGRLTTPGKDDKISPQDLKAVQAAFIKLGMSRLKFAGRDPKGMKAVEKVYAACEGVNDVQTEEGNTIADVSQENREKIRKEVPDLFVGGVKSKKKSGQR